MVFKIKPTLHDETAEGKKINSGPYKVGSDSFERKNVCPFQMIKYLFILLYFFHLNKKSFLLMMILNLDAFKWQMRSTSIFIHVSKVLSIKMEITISKEPLISNKLELCIFPKHIIRSTEVNHGRNA